jgi:hypothetical protein
VNERGWRLFRTFLLCAGVALMIEGHAHRVEWRYSSVLMAGIGIGALCVYVRIER